MASLPGFLDFDFLGLDHFGKLKKVPGLFLDPPRKPATKLPLLTPFFGSRRRHGAEDLGGELPDGGALHGYHARAQGQDRPDPAAWSLGNMLFSCVLILWFSGKVVGQHVLFICLNIFAYIVV